MIAIADSGATKTSWLFIDNAGNAFTYKSLGINPYYLSAEGIVTHLTAELLPQFTFSDTIHRVYFYGAGCEQEEKKQQVAGALKKVFSEAKIEVQHDLLAACRAVAGDNKGIVCIAGTGANSCEYDGVKVTNNIQSLGLFLGDEGSGGYMGKALLRDYTRNNMPAHIQAKFEARYTDKTSDILDKVYTKPFPSRYLASFVPFITENIDEKYIYDLVYKCFEDQFDNTICKYPNYQNQEISFVGSVAYFLRDVLEKVAKAKGAKISKVIRNPLEGLAEYHVLKGLMD